MTVPSRLNATNERQVSSYEVHRANDPAIERQQLNRILKSLDSRLTIVESQETTTSDSASDYTLVPDSNQFVYVSSGSNTYTLTIGPAGVTGTEIDFGSFDTDSLTEGSTNLFFTDERVDDRVAALIQDGTGIAWTYVDASGTLTGNVTLAPFDTDDLSEGVTNLYFTDERAQDAVGAMVSSSSNVTLTYTDATPSLVADLTNSGVTANTYGSASNSLTLTIDAKGRITSASSQAIAIAYGQVSGLGTVVTYDVGTSGATVPLLSTANTWSAAQAFTTLSATGSAATPLTLNRTDANGNVNIRYQNTGGSVYAGAHSGPAWSVGGSADLATAANRWFSVNAAGTAVTGTITGNSTITTTGSSGGIGYATGAGGTVTQLTSKSTGVTLNRPCGQITMNNAALAAGTIVSFVLTNSTIAATDVLVLNHTSGGTIGSYSFTASCAAGSATIYVRNNTAGSLSEAIVIRYALIKGVTS